MDVCNAIYWDYCMSHALTKRLQCTPTTPTNSPLVHRSQTMNSMVLFYVILWFHIYHAFKYLELRCNPYGNNSNILVRHSPYHPTANNPNVIHNTHTNATFGGDSIQYKPSKKPHHHRYREQ
eukprot:818703_1